MKLERLPRIAPDVERKLVGFVVGDVQYGLDIMAVSEVINPLALIALPAAPPYIAGAVSHRGAVVPIVDLRIRFRVPRNPASQRNRWIIVKTGCKSSGMIVDRTTGIVGVSRSHRRPELAPNASAAQSWIKDAFQIGGALIFELDADAVTDAPADTWTAGSER